MSICNNYSNNLINLYKLQNLNSNNKNNFGDPFLNEIYDNIEGNNLCYLKNNFKENNNELSHKYNNSDKKEKDKNIKNTDIKSNISTEVLKNIIKNNINNNIYLHDLEYAYNPFTGKNSNRK